MKIRRTKVWTIRLMCIFFKKWSLTEIPKLLRQLNLRIHLRTIQSLIIYSPNTSPIWWWVSVTDTLCAFKTCMIERTLHVPDVLVLLNIISTDCEASTLHTALSVCSTTQRACVILRMETMDHFCSIICWQNLLLDISSHNILFKTKRFIVTGFLVPCDGNFIWH